MDAMINATWFQAKEYDDEVMGKGIIRQKSRLLSKTKRWHRDCLSYLDWALKEATT